MYLDGCACDGDFHRTGAEVAQWNFRVTSKAGSVAKPGGGRSGRVALGLQEKRVAMSMVMAKPCGPWTLEVQQPFELKHEKTSTLKLVLSQSKSSFSSFSSHSALHRPRHRVHQIEYKERMPGLS